MIQPPTDNLYKFLAIFGLVLIGYSLYIPLQKLQEYGHEVVKWNAAWGPLLVRSLQMYEDDRAELVCAIAKASDTAALKSTSKDCTEVAAKSAQTKLNRQELARATAELQGGKGMLDYLEKQYVFYRNLGLATGFIGLLLCGAGFWLWYKRVQKPLDMASKSKP
jgi:hypothetical protein